MMVMKINFSPRLLIFLSLAAILVLYVLFQARFLILGPQVTILFPKEGQEVMEPLLTINGEARNISRISLNGRQIFTDESGFWSEKLLLSPGTSIMTVKVVDRFGREREERVTVILINQTNSSINETQDDQEQE
jgi:hypothetical protein